MKMMKNWIALLLALCMMAALGVASACCTEPTGMEEPQTMEETCACMMDGKGVDGCEYMDGMCGDKCACGEGCKCAEKRLDMLAAEMNALFEKNMELWNKLFGMMSKQPELSMTSADYLMEQLEAAREKFTQDEYKLLQQDIETIRRLDEEMSKLQEKMMPGDTMTMDPSMQDGMIDVTVIHPFKPIETPLIGLQLFTKQIDKNTNIHCFRTKELSIFRPKAAVMHIDGEPRMMDANLNIKCHKAGIKVFTPTTSTRSLLEPIENGFYDFINAIRAELEI